MWCGKYFNKASRLAHDTHLHRGKHELALVLGSTYSEFRVRVPDDVSHPVAFVSIYPAPPFFSDRFPSSEVEVPPSKFLACFSWKDLTKEVHTTISLLYIWSSHMCRYFTHRDSTHIIQTCVHLLGSSFLRIFFQVMFCVGGSESYYVIMRGLVSTIFAPTHSLSGWDSHFEKQGKLQLMLSFYTAWAVQYKLWKIPLSFRTHSLIKYL